VGFTPIISPGGGGGPPPFVMHVFVVLLTVVCACVHGYGSKYVGECVCVFVCDCVRVGGRVEDGMGYCSVLSFVPHDPFLTILYVCLFPSFCHIGGSGPPPPPGAGGTV